MHKDHAKAIELANSALQQALGKIDELEGDDFRDATSIIELLKENLALWKEEEEGVISAAGATLKYSTHVAQFTTT